MRALIVINSKNKKSQFSSELIKVINILSKMGYSTSVEPTSKQSNAYSIISNWQHPLDLIVAAGGDGTMYEVTNALKNLQNHPRIMYFPTGTINDFAASLKIPPKFTQQLQMLYKQEIKEVDSGLVNDKYFNYICAFGPFTRASYLTPHDKKQRFGKMAYIKSAISELPALSKSYYLRIEVDEEVLEGYFTMALVINSTSVGGFRNFIRDDRIDDGFFNLVLIRKANALALKKGIKHILSGINDNVDDEHYFFRKFKKLNIKTSDNVQWILDGEKGPIGSIDLKVIPKNIKIFVP